jgi:2,4-dienoyl-CoA reductase-like NADH-dependent reductase (Old Yellow Enzyme family)
MSNHLSENDAALADRRYPHLRSPISMGPLQLRHRAIMSGHGMRLGDGQGGIGDRLRGYLVTRAKGGAAMVSLASSPVHPGASDVIDRVHLFEDRIVPDLARTADAVHEAGSRLSAILWHGGHNISPLTGAPIAPSPIPASRSGDVPRVASVSDIREIVAAYGSAAARCRSAGLDAVEVQTASDYLLGSFLSPTLNRRTDSYGGSLENRVRIAAEVLQAVRDAVGGNVAVGVRASTAHCIPTDPSSFEIDESLAAMDILVRQGLVDWVSLVVGSHWAIHRLFPPMTEPRGHLAETAKRFRDQLTIPIIVAGRIRTPGEAEDIIAAGQADIVAMARTWIAEPEWMAKIERGEENRIRPCMSCNQGCLGSVVRGLPGTCVLNPVAGREAEFAPIERVAQPRRIAIIGGGPAGLEMARLAASRGDHVTLYEAQSRLGGDMRLAGEAPHRGEILLAIEWWQRELERLGVVVRLSERIDEAAKVDAETVVWAVGARPAMTAVWRLRPHLVAGIPGTENLQHGRDVLRDGVAGSGDVLVIDEEGGWPSVSLVETIAASNATRSLTVVTARRALGELDLAISEEIVDVSVRVAATGAVIHPGTLVARVEGQTAHTVDGRALGPFKSIVLSTGTGAPEHTDDRFAIGDCVAPRGFWAATSDARRLLSTL